MRKMQAKPPNNKLRFGIIAALIIAVIAIVYISSLPPTPTLITVNTTSTANTTTTIIFNTSISSSTTISPNTTINSSSTTIPVQAATSNSIYCVGGATNQGFISQSYYAPLLNSDRIGNWTETTPYPINGTPESCFDYDNYIYCMGQGVNNTFSYYARLSSAGIGNWSETTQYPSPISSPSCAVNNGYIYCVGGYNNITKGMSNLTYYAKLTSSGISNWSNTTPLNMSVRNQPCIANNGSIYCLDGYENVTLDAPLTPSGIGKWHIIEGYPAAFIGENCMDYSNHIYCIGGATQTGIALNSTYFTLTINTTGIKWVGLTSYPLFSLPLSSLSCVAANNNSYCIGGYTNQTYYIGLSNRGVTANAWNASTPYPLSIGSPACVLNLDGKISK